MPRPKTILTESMTKYERSGIIIRCWRQEEKTDSESIRESTQAVKEICNYAYEQNVSGVENFYHACALQVLEMERVNAVEVLDKATGIGVVLYADWP